MRFEFQSFSDAMIPSARESAGEDEWIELDRRNEWIAVSRERLLRTNSDRVGPWRSVAAAASVVIAHALACLTWGAVVLYPSLLGPQPRRHDDEERADDPSFFEPAGDRVGSHGVAIRSRIMHSEETPFITNGLVIFENPAVRGSPVPPVREPSRFRSLKTRLVSVPARLWARTARAHRNRKAVAELKALDDRMLKDIGISRGQIWDVVRSDENPRA